MAANDNEKPRPKESEKTYWGAIAIFAIVIVLAGILVFVKEGWKKIKSHPILLFSILGSMAALIFLSSA